MARSRSAGAAGPADHRVDGAKEPAIAGSMAPSTGDDGGVEPNLARIPAGRDADAEAILELARGGVTADLLDGMNGTDAIALGRYGARQATAALRRGSAPLLRDALLATAIGEIIRTGDPPPP